MFNKSYSLSLSLYYRFGWLKVTVIKHQVKRTRSCVVKRMRLVSLCSLLQITEDTLQQFRLMNIVLNQMELNKARC